MTDVKPTIVLFKGTIGEEQDEVNNDDNGHGGEEDSYLLEIVSRMLVPGSATPVAGALRVPVLRFERVANVESSTLKEGRQFNSVVVTSPRAMWALSVRPDGDELADALTRAATWFVVGEASAKSVRLFLSRRRADPMPTIVGSDAGSAQALFDRYMSSTAGASSSSLSGPLAYLCGDMRRSTLSDLLKSKGTQFEELVVYMTKPRNDLNLSSSPGDTPPWIASTLFVFFSPSGIEAVINSHVLRPEDESTRVCAIGETTASALRERTRWKLIGVAARPSPEALCDVLVEAMRHFPTSSS